MPVTGVKVTAYHCDAGAMANVVPNQDYGMCVLLCYYMYLMLIDCCVFEIILHMPNTTCHFMHTSANTH